MITVLLLCTCNLRGLGLEPRAISGAIHNAYHPAQVIGCMSLFITQTLFSKICENLMQKVESTKENYIFWNGNNKLIKNQE